MAIDVLKNSRVSGISCCVPEHIVDMNIFREELGEKGLRKFQKTTGILKKHCCTYDHIVTAGDLCYTAAKELLNSLEIERNTIDMIVMVTQSPDYSCPATACILQSRLGLSKECLAYDINLGCSGWIYGIHNAATYLQSGGLKRILLLAGEASAHDKIESNTLFGEAGTATLVEYDETAPESTFLLRTIGDGFRELMSVFGARHDIDHYVEAVMNGKNPKKTLMNGAEIFNFSIHEVPLLVKDYLEYFSYNLEMFDIVALHQANLIILQQIMKKLQLPQEKCPISLDIYGNTSSASVPLAICDYFNRLKPEEKDDTNRNILACGYGIGLSLGITAFSISGSKCLPVITTNEAFKDGLIL